VLGWSVKTGDANFNFTHLKMWDNQLKRHKAKPCRAISLTNVLSLAQSKALLTLNLPTSACSQFQLLNGLANPTGHHLDTIYKANYLPMWQKGLLGPSCLLEAAQNRADDMITGGCCDGMGSIHAFLEDC
jgi:hypothetical protein